MTLRTLSYGNYGIFLIMGNAGFCPSTVVWVVPAFCCLECLGAGGRKFNQEGLTVKDSTGVFINTCTSFWGSVLEV